MRPFEEKDFKETFAIYRSQATCQYLLHNPWTEKNAKEEFENKLQNNTLTEEHTLNVAVVFEAQVVGDLSLWYTGMKETVEIGYSFASSVNGKGLATEAMTALVKWLFDEKHIHRIQANLDARNVASVKLCERIGMRKEAHFIQNFWNKGEWTDSLVYGMLRSDVTK